jgi:hypothetical protein
MQNANKIGTFDGTEVSEYLEEYEAQTQSIVYQNFMGKMLDKPAERKLAIAEALSELEVASNKG